MTIDSEPSTAIEDVGTDPQKAADKCHLLLGELPQRPAGVGHHGQVQADHVLVRLGHHLDEDPPTVRLVPGPPHEPGPLQPVEDERHRTGREPRGLGQCPRRHRGLLVEDVEAPEVGAVDAEAVGDGLVEDVDRHLVPAHGLAELTAAAGGRAGHRGHRGHRSHGDATAVAGRWRRPRPRAAFP